MPDPQPEAPAHEDLPPAPPVTGDAINATIGSGARNVAVGKGILIIGNLNLPLWSVGLLAALVVAGFAFLGWWLSRKPAGPTVMSGSFNVAIADFGELDAQGQAHPSARGQLLSRRLFEGLQIEFNSLPKSVLQDFQPQAWHDSLDSSQKGVKLGIIPGATSQEREQAACRLAEKIRARVMIYGNLPAEGAASDFIPEFAICNNAQLRLDADEIVGSHPAGEGIPASLLRLLNDANVETSVNIQLNAWSNSFSTFSIGIMYDLAGRPAEALKIFTQAQQSAAEAGQAQGPGSQVLWFFIGRENLLLNHKEEAQQAFEAALKADPAYARAHIGLGSTFLDQAEDLAPQDRANSPDLQNAIDQYQQALAGAAESPGALVDVKATLGWSAALLAQGEMQRDQGNLAAAENSFREALVKSTSTVQPLAESKQFRVLAQAYLTVGQANHQLGHLKVLENDPAGAQSFFNQAVQAYQQCIDQQAASPADGILSSQVVAELCRPDQQAARQAAADLEGVKP